jgi:predicted transcriptional regulator
MLDDYVIVASAAVIVAAAVILAASLYRYQKLVDEAAKSSRLAKDVWDSVNSRFSVVDARIIDLMVKTEVISSKLGTTQQSPELRLQPTVKSVDAGPVGSSSMVARKAVSSEAAKEYIGRTETELKVLRFLVEGPKTSAQIKDVIGKSREHTARLLKILFERGLVIRNDKNKPYVYEITDNGRSYVAS